MADISTRGKSMNGWCVFCGAETSGGIMVCPKCQPYRDGLTENKRLLLEQMEADNKAQESFYAACVNLRVTMEELIDAGASLLGQFGMKKKKDGADVQNT